jgi:cytochrome c oxidase cbb3-type subunit 3
MAENNPYPDENNTGHIWDDNLRELRNPAPNWWMIGFWASVAWWIAYGIFFPMWPGIPGLFDTTPGVGVPGISDDGGWLNWGKWTQIEEYQGGVEEIEAKRAEYEKKIAGMTPEQIIEDPGLTQYTLASAKVLFGDNCSACHGSGGQGNPGYPVLADDDWLYGGTVAKLTETLQMGRKGAMIAYKDTLSEAEVDTLANWVVQLSEGQKGSDEGWNLFRTKGCTACHGPDADGAIAKGPNGEVLATVGAANLTDGIWRFEPGGFESAKHTILYGVNQPGVEGTRDAVMPAFGQTGKLGEQEIKKLVVYVHQLGGGQ